MPDPILLSLLRINRHRMRGLRKLLAPAGYTGTMHLILSFICRNPGSSQEQVACHFSLDKTGVARDARRLEDLGHIERKTVPEDRRRYALYPTERGTAMYDTVCRYYDALAAEMTADFSAEERALLDRLLARAANNLDL